VSVRMPNVAAMGASGATQLSFADLGPAWDPAACPTEQVSLRETTFVVVDLETTGGRTRGSDGTPPDAITEIGAVKVRGGAVLGEFATLVDPQRSIPPQIVQLTGITTAMVCDAPTIDAVLPMFFEFAGDSVLVAHNAGFDIGFLRAAAQRCNIPWRRPQVLCTVRLARRVLSREEAPSVRLAALARLFAVAAQPTHRALDDARATVDVLHALIERVGNQGVHTYADLRSYLPDVTPTQRRKRVLADGLPRSTCDAGSASTSTAPTPAAGSRRWSRWPTRSSMSSARTRWRPVCGNCGCWPHTPRRTTAGRGFRSGGGGLR
jgi:DNA polymerase-3 subunit epsilon